MGTHPKCSGERLASGRAKHRHFEQVSTERTENGKGTPKSIQDCFLRFLLFNESIC
jgi:hypothetical protein